MKVKMKGESSIGFAFYILADTFFVSKGLGADGLCALNIAVPMYNVINGCGLMISIGAAARYVICKAQKNDREADRIFSNAFIFSGIIALIFFVIGLFLPYQLASLLGAKGEILPMAGNYLKVLFLCGAVYLYNNLFVAFIRNDGDPKLAMWATLMGTVLNIFLDYIFIFKLHLGMTGAALGTACAPALGILISSIHLFRKKNGFHLVKKSLSNQIILKNLSVGFSSFVTEVSAGLVIIIYNLLILQIAGNVGVAAYGVIANIALVVSYIYIGISQGMHLYFTGAFFSGFNILASMYFSAKEQVRPAHMISVFRGFLLMIPVVYAMAYFFSLKGIWLSVPVTEGIVSIYAIVLLYRQRRIAK